MKALLDQNGLDRRPHDVSNGLWYYEEKAGLKFYRLVNGRSEYAGIIPWRSIAASLRRYDAAKANPKRAH